MNPAPKIAPKPAQRMTLGAVTKGRIEAPLRTLLYGVPGIGKSTYAAGAPAPIFLGAEDGTNNLDVARFPMPTEWAEVLDAVRLLAEESHDYKTLVIDTLDSIEPLCWRAVVARDKKASNIEEVSGGYGKGYVAAVDEWRVLLAALERVRSRGVGIVLLAHAAVKSYKNPEGPDYDRFVMKLDARAAAAFAEWCDLHLFARFDGGVTKDGKKTTGYMTQIRIVHAVRAAAYEAKNRFSLPATMPLDWDEIAAAVRRRQVAAPAEIRASIEALLVEADEAFAKLVRDTVAKTGDDAAKLAEIENRARAKLAPKEQS